MKLSRKSAIRDEKIILTIVFSVFESKKAFKFCIFCLRNCEKILPLLLPLLLSSVDEISQDIPLYFIFRIATFKS